MSLTLTAYLAKVATGELDPKEVVLEYLQKIRTENADLFPFLRLHEKYIEDHLEEIITWPLKGAPIGIKDNMMLQGEISSCGSKMLEHYTAPYTATCVEKLIQAGALPVGKTNMDEFAMGSSTEHSAFWVTRNPYGKDRVPGWTSGGSAAAVAADLCLAALGSDTGGSIRQPAAFCGIVGLRPTYGRVSRYGVQSYASSFDQVGVLGKTAADVRLLLEVVAGYDERDSQSDKKADIKDFSTASPLQPSTIRIAVPNEAFSKGLDPRVEKLFREKLAALEKQGYQVDFVDLPILKQAIPVYYMLVAAEVTSNLAKFDGMRFGLQGQMSDFSSLPEYYAAMRSQGFGSEVKKRLLLGNYVVAHENYEKYYKKWYEARKFLRKEFTNIFQTYQIIATPTAPTPARKIGGQGDDPLMMYLQDFYTVTAPLAGLPAISLPMGTVTEEDGDLPVGIQLMGAKWKEGLLLDIAEGIEKKS